MVPAPKIVLLTFSSVSPAALPMSWLPASSASPAPLPVSCRLAMSTSKVDVPSTLMPSEPLPLLAMVLS